MGSNDKVCKLLSGVFNLRPPQLKYTFMWDVQIVLEYIKVNLPVKNVLSDKLLSPKLSMLLALASASRTIPIQDLDISQMVNYQINTNLFTPSYIKAGGTVNPASPPLPCQVPFSLLMLRIYSCVW